ncbi:MAG: hypothetical protein M1838_000378 [Thelocarpon superellum]|nr:MAG: hypothetical protein M1838_000378 [Thelocarpon superellum]
MGRIKKTAGPKHAVALPPVLGTLIGTAAELPLPQLPALLTSVSPRWPYPRGDLYNWIPLLNRFDSVLEVFNKEYRLNEGPQAQPFDRRLLRKGDIKNGSGASSAFVSEAELDQRGFGPEGDRELIEAILTFSTLLLENCGNRSLYSSSAHLNDLINTTSLSLLSHALRLGVRCAQRYLVSRQRTVGSAQHHNFALLASHWNINLDKMQKLAVPFQTQSTSGAPAKGKEKIGLGARDAAADVPPPVTDLVTMAKGSPAGNTQSVASGPGRDRPWEAWEAWGNVSLTYTPTAATDADRPIPVSPVMATISPTGDEPVTPTPRRSQGAAATSSTPRRSRLSQVEDAVTPSRSSPAAPVTSKKDEEGLVAVQSRTLDVPYDRIATTPLYQIIATAPADMPRDARYDLLHRLRVAAALATSLETRREMLGIRILAITNLAYIHPETTFQQKVLQQDADEPRRLQVVYQLAELVHPASDGARAVPRRLQTLALGGLEALARHKSKVADVCTALSVNVNHGVLLYVVRKAVAEMTVDGTDKTPEGAEEDDWREALFALLSYLPETARTGEALVAAGLLPILLDILTLRTDKAERTHPKVLNFLDTFVYHMRDAFQTLAQARGLDIIADLTAFEVESGFTRARAGEGMPANTRNRVIDYELPFFKQQTLRCLFKLINHMMSHGGGNIDRLLRNLIDSPRLLGALRTILTHASVFGSNVWSGAVNILSSFIHNEPTSYAVIAEAGLSRGFLEAVSCATISMPEDPPEAVEADEADPATAAAPTDAPLVTSTAEGSRPGSGAAAPMSSERAMEQSRRLRLVPVPQQPQATGILPATDAIVALPQAFGAICLTTAGMKLFRASTAVDSFFQIFLSPAHVKTMFADEDLPNALGTAFDELVRHHPALKPQVMSALLFMLVSVGQLCRAQARAEGLEASTTSAMPRDVDMRDADATGAAPAPPLAVVEGIRFPPTRGPVGDGDKPMDPPAAAYLDVTAKFLIGFFSNTSMCTAFIEAGGAEWLLDLTTLPIMRADFDLLATSPLISRVVHILVEQKPHLVLPSLLHRIQLVLKDLRPFQQHAGQGAFFGYLMDVDQGSRVIPPATKVETGSGTASGATSAVPSASASAGATRSAPSSAPLLTPVPEQVQLGASTATYLQALLKAHTLTAVLRETFSQPLFNHRSSHTIFSQVNLTDMYVTLIADLGALHRACVREEIILQRTMPKPWKDYTRPTGLGRSAELEALVSRADMSPNGSASAGGMDGSPSVEDTAVTIAARQARMKITQTLRLLLDKIPAAITSFYNGLGRVLVTKRQVDSYQKQNAVLVAEAIAQALNDSLGRGFVDDVPAFPDRHAMWIVALTALSQIVMDVPLDRPSAQCLTVVLNAFKTKDGFDTLRAILDTFASEIRDANLPGDAGPQTADTSARLASCYHGIQIILGFYAYIVSAKNIVEASQTTAMASRDRFKEKPDYFSPNQFLVELRLAVLPVVRSMWDSDLFHHADSTPAKCMIITLRTILDGDHEAGAYKRSDKIARRGKAFPRTWREPAESHTRLANDGYDHALIREALYRCNNNANLAEDYCLAQQRHDRAMRLFVPERERPAAASARVGHAGRVSEPAARVTVAGVGEDEADEGESSTSSGHGPALPMATSSDMELDEIGPTAGAASVDRSMPPPPPAPGLPADQDAGSETETGLAMNIDHLLGNLRQLNVPTPPAPGPERMQEGTSAATTTSVSPARDGSGPSGSIEIGKMPEIATIDDLDEMRVALRASLIDRALDILNVHGDVTFELADLVMSAVAKAAHPDAMRAEIGETLVQSLMSLQLDDDFRPASKKVAAYANLLGLVLQDRPFYEATLGELRANFPSLLGFIKTFPDQPTDVPSPWIGQILLIVERLLAEDAQPRPVKWTPPASDNAPSEAPIIELGDSLIPPEQKTLLFDAVLQVLPRVGTDDGLALAVARALVMLTRSRFLALRLGERANLQRLFVMVKQLAGRMTDKIQATILIVLRHVIEDEETLRHIMRSEIKAFFETRQSTRQLDTNGYVRSLYHLVLRAPEIFTEISGDMLKLVRFDPSQRHQMLALKDVARPTIDEPAEATEPAASTTTANASTKQPADMSPSAAATDKPSKASHTEVKAPVVEHPDGVIHYLLSELLSYKDVDDTEGSPAAFRKDAAVTSPELDTANGGASSATPTGTSPGSAATPTAGKKMDKSEFHADQHPIYIYRCFLLQCLTELLSCYNRTKVEFINFSRKTAPQVMTPSKPRSGVLNYLLTDLIPVGTLEHAEEVGFRKRFSTSNWTIATVVALCSKTGERGFDRRRETSDGDDEPDLLFVRKFVLEHALKAYRDASSAVEPLDRKYARMLSLADLFHRMLTGRPISGGNTATTEMIYASQRQLARIMFEKNYIAALTNSVADIDLNFPAAKRAVKYILRPLKQLTQTAIELSESASTVSAPSQPEEDEISSATSVSDEVEDGREETPDLFRNSTLGMFEPGREQESSSESSDGDEDMYDDEYGEGMEYDDEGVEDDGDVVSEDEDDEDATGLDHLQNLPGSLGLNVQLVLNQEPSQGMTDDDEEDGEDDEEDGEGDDEDDSEDEDDEDDDDDDEADEHEIDQDFDAEEAAVAQAEDAEAEGEEWQSEDEEDEEVDDYDGAEDMIRTLVPRDSPLEHIVRALEGDNGSDMLHHLGPADLHHRPINLDAEGNYLEDAMDEDEDDEDDDEDAMDEEEDAIYEEEFDEDAAFPTLPYNWDGDGEAPITARGQPNHHHHHHHHPHNRRGAGPWSHFLDGGRDPGMVVPTFRSHRPGGGGSRRPDDGTNPLLHRTGGPPSASLIGRSSRHDPLSDWAGPDSAPRVSALHESPVSLINNLINAIGHGPGALSGMQHHGGALHFQIAGSSFPGNMPGEIQAMLGFRRTPPEGPRTNRDDPAQVVNFVPSVTSGRWQEEARILFGAEFAEKTHRVVNALLAQLVPPALEEAGIRRERAAAELRQLQLEKDQQAEEERLNKEEAAQQAQAQAQREAEERTAAMAEAAAAAAAATDEPTDVGHTGPTLPGPNVTENQEAMEGVEVTHTPATHPPDEATAGPSTSGAPRIHSTLRGYALDITDMDIDPEYLAALPDELRDEVLLQQLAEQRSQRVATGEQPTDISPEFLEALPDEIREELLEQEAQDRRRREREEARRNTAAPNNSGAAAGDDMDPATVLATLDPGLRQAILMEQDEDVLAQLPRAIAAEARALGGERLLRHHLMGDPRAGRPRIGLDLDGSRAAAAAAAAAKKQPRRTIVQMLDKPGVATLLRLMFIPQTGSARQTLNAILQNVCENRQTRHEVVTLLLSILQDGSADMTAVERSFAYMSLRARQPPTPKTSQPLKRTASGMATAPAPTPTSTPVAAAPVEMSPLMVIQQCLSSLVLLVHFNPHIRSFFLTEHETAIGLKRTSGKKGKGKEKDGKASRFALNALLGLLDRKMIIESSTVMEQLSNLLNSITHPLTMLLKKDAPNEEAASTALAATTAMTAITEQAASTPIPTEAPTLTSATLDASGADPVPDGPGTSATAATAVDDDGANKAKKPRTLVPPVIPDHNLRLIVKILAARECSAKTFRDTLSTINNLSAIPAAKEVFGQELVRQAQTLGQSILVDLTELIPQIQKAQTGTDVQGMALAKFSPASSDQAKLLRALTALDYLFDPKKAGSGATSSDTPDLLSRLYDNATFGPLWAKLSECLAVIRQRENMLNVATILLPLIEALMVVCKNTTLQSAAPSSKKEAGEATDTAMVGSPIPADHAIESLEQLFFNFTEEHRKILNDLVRHSPKLMSGTFSLLVKNPKVLEFDNKRNYFTRRLHARGAESRHSQPPLQLSVRRDQVFLDSFKSLYFKTGEEMKYGKLSIRFHGEEGVDAGGVTREWFQAMSRQMFNPDYALFQPVESDRTSFHPNKLSAINPEHFMFFKFIGRIIGKALYEGRVLDCHFSRPVYKRILGQSVSVKDMEKLDLSYYTSLRWMLDTPDVHLLDLTFVAESDAFGEQKRVNLKENGHLIAVTDENKHEYVRLMAEHHLTGSIQEQLEHFLRGFHDIVPAELISIFSEQELELLISGLPDIDVDDWKNNTEYHNYTASSPQMQWFWRAVRSFDKEERAKLLQFVTGTSKVPLNGFKELEGMNGFSRFNIHRDFGSKDRLPSSHTCFNQLDLPEYDSYEMLRKQVFLAMTVGSEYFGFA